VSWILESLSRWGIEPAPECALCHYLSLQVERLGVEVLELRLQVADGPRARVQELERNLARANALIAQHNGQTKGKR
jgi:hypothetical protein